MKRLILFLCSFFSLSAHALITIYPDLSGTSYFSDAGTACANHFPSSSTGGSGQSTQTISAGYVGIQISSTSYYCYQDVQSCYVGACNTQRQTVGSVSGQIACDTTPTYPDASGVCPTVLPPCASKSGQVPAGGVPSVVVLDYGTAVPNIAHPPQEMCIDGCAVSLQNSAIDMTGSTPPNNFAWVSNTGGSFSGSACSGSVGSGPPVTQCAKGQCPISIGASVQCAPCAATSTTSTTTTTAPVTSGGAGSVSTSTTSTTSCSGASCQTSTTTSVAPSDPAASGTSTTSTVQSDLRTFCASNSTSPLCSSVSGSFGGDCSAGFSCSGDAVQCAIARQSHLLACQVSVSPTDSAVVAGQAAMSASGVEGWTSTVALPDPSAAVDLLPGGSCPSDYVFSYAGSSLTLPFSRLCDSMVMLGNILVALVALACLRITFV